MDINSELYDGKSLADLFTEIHKNTDSKRAQINSFIMKMVQFMNMGVHNLEHRLRHILRV